MPLSWGADDARRTRAGRRARRFVGFVIAGMLALVLGAATVPSAATPRAARRRADDSKPNILFVLTDDQTMDALSTTMPYLASRPRGSWITFTNAFLSDPLCCPARATILSGQYARHTGVVDNIDTPSTFRDSDTIATWLQTAGYTTGLFGKYFNHYPWDKGDSYVPPGWNDWFAFEKKAGYFKYQIDDNGTVENFGNAVTDYSTDVTAAKTAQFIAATGTQPFLAYWAPHAPHQRWVPAPKYRSLFDGVTPPHSPNVNEADVSDKPEWIRDLPLLSEDELAVQDADRINGWRTLRSVDDGMRSLVKTLNDTGKLANTVIVFMTDNGYSFGSHRWVMKECPYDECIRTPMMIRFPGSKNRTSKAFVSDIDIAPTIAALAGATPTIAEDGTSLVPLLDGSAKSVHDQLFFEWAGGYDGEGTDPVYIPAWKGVRTARYMYVELETGETELYDLKNDPYELTNEAGQPAFHGAQQQMAARLATWTN